MTLEQTDMAKTSRPGCGARRKSFLTAATLLAAALWAAPSAWAQSDFGNPQDGSYHSGATIFAGWHCSAKEVTLEIDGGAWVLDAATQTEFGLTEEFCGDTNNGWSVLWNANQFGNGPHTVIAKADGIAFGGERTFFVTKPTDANRATDLVGNYTLPDFPSSGQAVDVTFQVGTQNFGIAPAGSTSSPAPPPTSASSVSKPSAVTTAFNFGNPAVDSFASGVIIFNGWICDANEVWLQFDGETAMSKREYAGYPTARDDTKKPDGPCDSGETGFALLKNANQLGTGAHTAELYIDGELATSQPFWVTMPSDELFNRDISGEFRLPGFPDETKDTQIVWQTEDQNFAIKTVASTAGPTPTPGPGSVPTPGITPTPTPDGSTTPTPDGDSTPTPTAGDGPTPTPTPASLCGNGEVDVGEECDGDNFDGNTCEDIIGGWDPEEFGPNCAAGSALECAPDCTLITSGCDCPCEADDDCTLPEHFSIDCAATYCPLVCASLESNEPGITQDCLEFGCQIGGDFGDIDSACIGSDFNTGAVGFCLTNPFDPGENDSELIDLCLGADENDIDFPRCDYCDDF